MISEETWTLDEGTHVHMWMVINWGIECVLQLRFLRIGKPSCHWKPSWRSSITSLFRICLKDRLEPKEGNWKVMEHWGDNNYHLFVALRRKGKIWEKWENATRELLHFCLIVWFGRLLNIDKRIIWCGIFMSIPAQLRLIWHQVITCPQNLK